MARFLGVLVLLAAAALLAVGWIVLREGTAGDAQPATSSTREVHAPAEVGEAARAVADAPRVAPPGDAERALAELDTAHAADRERAAGRPGSLVRGTWPGGAKRFEGHQTKLDDGSWVLDGAWSAWHANGELEQLGAYVRGREHGDWQWWYASGAPQAEGRFADGARVGTWTYWHEHGDKLAEGAWVAGERSGRWTFWHADGRVHAGASGEYRDGQRVDD